MVIVALAKSASDYLVQNMSLTKDITFSCRANIVEIKIMTTIFIQRQNIYNKRLPDYSVSLFTP